MYYCKDLNCEDMIEGAKAAIIEALTDGEYSGYYCDLHNHVFNEDYHYCYTSEAEDDLNAIGVFNAISVIVKTASYSPVCVPKYIKKFMEKHAKELFTTTYDKEVFGIVEYIYR